MICRVSLWGWQRSSTLINFFLFCWSPSLSTGWKFNFCITTFCFFSEYYKWHFVYSPADDLCYRTLLSVIETVPARGLVGHMVSKLLHTCVRLSKTKSELASHESGYICYTYVILCADFNMLPRFMGRCKYVSSLDMIYILFFVLSYLCWMGVCNMVN